MSRLPPTLVLLSVVGLAGCTKGEGATCREGDSCDEGLVCLLFEDSDEGRCLPERCADDWTGYGARDCLEGGTGDTGS